MNDALPRVLVVDDNDDLRANLAEILEGANYQVVAAPTSHDAERLIQDSLDLALIDMRLADRSGLELATRIRELHPDCEVIFLTGFASIESAAASVRAGAWAYLVKPVTVPNLMQVVDQALRHVRTRRDNRLLERRAQVAEKLAAVGTLTAGLTHEIRNPLNAALLQLAVLERRIQKLPRETNEPLNAPLTLVRDEIKRLNQILEDFLQFARPIAVEHRPVDVNALVGTVTAFLQHEADARGVHLVVEPTRVPEVSGDEARLRQVLMNLCLNALDAAPRGGHVNLSARKRSQHVELLVDDSGPGLKPEVAARIFEPFFTTKATGSGLGLPICHAIVSQHGGTIEAGTSPLGGARFVVRLPVA